MKAQTLQTRISRRPLPTAESISIAIQIAHALGEAHRSGIVHGDLSPVRIELMGGDRVKILDSGRSVSTGRTTETQPAISLEPSPYWAPEQIATTASDVRSDIWALGVILYEMLTGRQPFTKMSELGLQYAIQFEQPEPPGSARRGIPGDLQRIVRLAMAKRPERRYQNVRDLAADLQAVRDGRKPTTATPHRTTFATHRSMALSRRGFRRLPVFQRTALIVFGSLLVVLVVLVFWSGNAPWNLTSPDHVALAVLPFQDMTFGKASESWGLDIQSEMARELASSPRVRVADIATLTDSIQARLGHPNPRRGRALFQVIQEFDVHYIVDGGIFRNQGAFVLRGSLVEPYSTLPLHTAEEDITGGKTPDSAATAIARQMLDYLEREVFATSGE
jgi:TolB-like protein